MQFRSATYPELRVSDIGVKFRNGEAEVTDETAIVRLRALGHLGVEPVEAEPAGESESSEPEYGEETAEKVEPVEAEPKRKPGRPKKSDS